jgi:hypothetical protein
MVETQAQSERSSGTGKADHTQVDVVIFLPDNWHLK